MARLIGNMKGTSMLGDEALTNADYASDLNTISQDMATGAAQPGIAAAGKVDSGAMALGRIGAGAQDGLSRQRTGSAFWQFFACADEF